MKEFDNIFSSSLPKFCLGFLFSHRKNAIVDPKKKGEMVTSVTKKSVITSTHPLVVPNLFAFYFSRKPIKYFKKQNSVLSCQFWHFCSFISAI